LLFLLNFLELIEKILVYKLPSKSREEIEAMFGLEDFKQTRFYQDAKAEGKLEGKLEGEASLIVRLLKWKFGQLSAENETRINQLSLIQLENLGEALLDFHQEQDLHNWLSRNN
jgi:predicted transposase YdaD